MTIYFIPPRHSKLMPIMQPESNHIGIESLRRSGWEKVPREEYEAAMERWREGRDRSPGPEAA